MGFGVTVNANRMGSPRWLADFHDRGNMAIFPAKVVITAFRAQDAVLAKANGAAAQSATSITVDPLSGPIPSGTILEFGSGEYATLTADAATGATTLAVSALVNGIEDNDEAWYAGTGLYPRRLKSGTFVGRTLAERDAGTGYGPAASTDEEFGLVLFDVPDLVAVQGQVELVRPNAGVYVKRNYLPDYTTIAADAGLLADLAAAYNLITGTD